MGGYETEDNQKALFILVSVSLLGACSELKDNRVTKPGDTNKSVKRMNLYTCQSIFLKITTIKLKGKSYIHS